MQPIAEKRRFRIQKNRKHFINVHILLNRFNQFLKHMLENRHFNLNNLEHFRK